MRQTYIAQVKAHDNYKLEVKIDYPGKSDGIVIFCHGSGPNTYDNPREIEGKHFNYFDLFADEFCRRSLAFCRWNTRGCAVSNHPPDFVAIDRAGYETYCPATSIQDIITVKNYVKALPQFRYAKILLMGISEGATLAPFAAVQCDDIAGLLLAGFSYGNMRDTLNWQLSGGSSMVNMCKYFDCREKGFIEKEDFVRDKYNVRPTLFQDIPFEALDIDGDGKEEYIITDGKDLFIYRKESTGFVCIWRTNISVESFYGNIYTGDTNGDGVKEIYICDNTGTAIKYILTPNGLISDNEKIDYGNRIYAGDFDGNGKDDYLFIDNAEEGTITLNMGE